MKPKDAKRILSGELRAINFFGGYKIMLYQDKVKNYGTKIVSLNQRDMQFALRQLALKTKQEKGKP